MSRALLRDVAACPPADAETSVFSSVGELLEEVRQGRPVILVDDENRENEGDLVIPAAKVTSEIINFMITHGRGLVCMPMAGYMIDRLELPPMAARNTSRYGTAFTVSIGAREGVTTGISAYDRAKTIQVAADPHTKPEDLTVPGHIFPLRAAEGGVLERQGHTEAAVDIARLAGFQPAGVICEIIKDDGTLARVPDLASYARRHSLKMGSIESLIKYRKDHKL